VRHRSHLISILIALLFAVAIGCPSEVPVLDPPPPQAPVRSAEPPPWEPPGTEDPEAFAWGVQSGDAAAVGAVLSVRTTEDDVILVLARADGDSGWIDASADELVVPESGVVQTTVAGLEPDTAYSYAFLSADGERRSRPGRFRTAPAAGTTPRVVTFGASHGFKGNQAWPSLSWAADEKLDAFFLLGDTVYADDANELDEYREYWIEALEQEGMADLTASTSMVAIWDDHEVANNWLPADLDPQQLDDALTAYREALPQRIGPGGSTVWRAITWGDTAEVIVLDSRGERTEDAYLSEQQMTWLQDALTASDARFKVILNSVPITDFSPLIGDALAFDRWSGYPEDRAEILEFIDTHGIEGVLWLTGDFHMGTINRIDPPGGQAHDQWEVMVGTTGSALNAVALVAEPDEQFHQIIHAWCYTWLELDPATGQAHVRFIDDGGELVAEQILSL
jgi:phosphodiesterase/alkaline phosphatase D-like protein